MILHAVAHGTRSPTGQRQIRSLVGEVARRRPDLDVRLSYLDVQQPRLAPSGPGIVVPLLLSAGYHVRTDIPAAVAGTGAIVTPPLGPDPVLVSLLAGRVSSAGSAHGAIVLAAAGSTDPRARADVCRAAAGLRARLGRPVHVAYAASATPRVPDVVARLRAAGARRVTIASYLLADGQFHRSLSDAGADTVTDPLAPDLANLVLHRYDTAAALSLVSSLVSSLISS